MNRPDLRIFDALSGLVPKDAVIQDVHHIQRAENAVDDKQYQYHGGEYSVDFSHF